MPLRHSKHHEDHPTSSHRRFSSISNKITGFRRPHQTVPAAEHGTAQLIYKEPSHTLDHPQHYHSLNSSTQQPNMSTLRHPQPQAPRVHFAGSTPPPSYHQQDYPRDRSSSQSSSSTASHRAIISNTTGNLHSNPVSVASSRSSFDLEPSGPVAEWCHQMHIMQSRRYDWCAGCFPRPVAVKDEEYAALAREEEESEKSGGAFSQAWEEEEQREQDEEFLRREKMVRRVRESRGAAHAYQ